MARQMKPRPPLRLPTGLPTDRPPPYELEHETVVAKDQNALTRRAAAGWRVAWLLTSTKNFPDGQGGNPLQAVWEILWERPVVVPSPPEEQEDPLADPIDTSSA